MHDTIPHNCLISKKLLVIILTGIYSFNVVLINNVALPNNNMQQQLPKNNNNHNHNITSPTPIIPKVLHLSGVAGVALKNWPVIFKY